MPGRKEAKKIPSPENLEGLPKLYKGGKDEKQKNGGNKKKEGGKKDQKKEGGKKRTVQKGGCGCSEMMVQHP